MGSTAAVSMAGLHVGCLRKMLLLRQQFLATIIAASPSFAPNQFCYEISLKLGHKVRRAGFCALSVWLADPALSAWLIGLTLVLARLRHGCFVAPKLYNSCECHEPQD